MYLGQAMGICPGLMNFQTFDTFGTPQDICTKGPKYCPAFWRENSVCAYNSAYSQ